MGFNSAFKGLKFLVISYVCMETNNCGFVESLSTETARKRQGWKYWIRFALSVGNIASV